MRRRRFHVVKWGGVDVTDHVLPFAGVNEDFHAFKLTPKGLGFENASLVFYNDGGEELPSPLQST